MLLRGVPLEQVAAVHAAVAEGFDLDEVLAVEGLPKRAWFEAELSWKRRLVEDDAAVHEAHVALGQPWRHRADVASAVLDQRDGSRLVVQREHGERGGRVALADLFGNAGGGGSVQRERGDGAGGLFFSHDRSR